MPAKVRYPYASAVARAEELSKRVKSQFPSLFLAKSPPTFGGLKEVTKQNKVLLVENEIIPGNKEAVLIDVEGINHILLNQKLRRKKEDRMFYLGHELGHVLLEHQSTFVATFSERPYTKDQALQVLYENEREMEANFFSMMLIAPDPFLDHIVDEKIYISAYLLKDRLEIGLGIAVARIELYRSMYGYDNSYLAAARKRGAMDEAKVMSQELPRDSHGLEYYLPEISYQLLSYIN